MDFKEYSKLRSIARKRIERASAAGKTPYVKIPTVAAVRASANPNEYMKAVRDFLNNPSASLTAAKKQAVEFPEITFTPLPPASRKEPMSAEQKRARRNEQKRRSKAKRAVEKAAPNEKEARRRVGYLRALETVSEDWKKAGVDIGNWLGVLSPAKSKAFVAYMEYRFSQGDYKNRYAIDTFIRDFGTLVQRGYDFKDIEKDFGYFLEQQKKLKTNKRKTLKYGITEDEIDSTWRRFVKEINIE